jgi:hypothetical protein
MAIKRRKREAETVIRDGMEEEEGDSQQEALDLP